jgi:phosphoglycerate dehydrogenase-like enzyme
MRAIFAGRRCVMRRRLRTKRCGVLRLRRPADSVTKVLLGREQEPPRPTIVLAMGERLKRYGFTADELDRLAHVGDLLDRDPLTSFDDDQRAADLLAKADVLVGHWGCPVLDDAAVAAAPRLRLFAYAAGTIKHVVSPAAWRAEVRVSTAAAANARPVAEYTLAVVLLAGKGAFATRERLRDSAAAAAVPRPIGNLGRRIGVVGASRVGRQVIELLRPFDLEVVVADPYLDDDGAAELGVELVSLEELVETSDVVTVHAPLLPSTRGLIDAPLLARMKDGATLVNTARGAVIDQDALVAELATGRITAVLDVTDPEPLPPDHPLLTSPAAFVTPHIAGAAGTELRRLADAVITEVERWTRGEPLLHEVRESDLDRIA